MCIDRFGTPLMVNAGDGDTQMSWRPGGRYPIPSPIRA
jgi:hypothetical protein